MASQSIDLVNQSVRITLLATKMLTHQVPDLTVNYIFQPQDLDGFPKIVGQGLALAVVSDVPNLINKDEHISTSAYIISQFGFHRLTKHDTRNIDAGIHVLDHFQQHM